ncbi:putative membrane protein [Synechococcus sp. RS9902]|nr:putative membrane protein [Synechococcus sp. RS9902]
MDRRKSEKFTLNYSMFGFIFVGLRLIWAGFAKNRRLL